MQDNSKEIKTRRKETNHVKTHQGLSVSRHKLCLLCCNTPWLIKKPKLSLAPIQEAHFTMVWYKFWRKLIFSILIVALVILKCCCTSWLHRIWRNISWKCCCIKIFQRYRVWCRQLFVRKCDTFFKSPILKKKKYSKNYPELEIQNSHPKHTTVMGGNYKF